MELSNEFDVAAPIDEAWKVLTDLETIAPCMPGAQLTEVEGDDYRGTVKIKVGPITAKFKGTASFVEQDVANHRAVLRAKGKDTGGKGNADATITAQLSPAGTGTHVVIATDLNISGRVAQFGRGALADVSSKLLGQFVDCLESNVLGGDGCVGRRRRQRANRAGGSRRLRHHGRHRGGGGRRRSTRVRHPVGRPGRARTQAGEWRVAGREWGPPHRFPGGCARRPRADRGGRCREADHPRRARGRRRDLAASPTRQVTPATIRPFKRSRALRALSRADPPGRATSW